MTTTFFLFLLDKNNGERKKKRENKNTCEYERASCFKSCQKVDVQISFLNNKQMLPQTGYIMEVEEGKQIC